MTEGGRSVSECGCNLRFLLQMRMAAAAAELQCTCITQSAAAIATLPIRPLFSKMENNYETSQLDFTAFPPITKDFELCVCIFSF